MNFLKLVLVSIIIFNFNYTFSQEKQSSQILDNKFNARIGVIDMQKILNDSTAYQGIVEKFENIRRDHRNKITKLEDKIRDDENNLFKQKNIISKEAYSEKVNEISKKINNLKMQKNNDIKKFEIAFEKSTNKIQRALVDVLSVIANKENLSLVMAKNQVLLVGKDIDLTDNAIKELNGVLPNVELDLKK